MITKSKQNDLINSSSEKQNCSGIEHQQFLIESKIRPNISTIQEIFLQHFVCSIIEQTEKILLYPFVFNPAKMRRWNAIDVVDDGLCCLWMMNKLKARLFVVHLSLRQPIELGSVYFVLLIYLS
ncbi:hypothetical protein BLOT_011202 [Blomia tropicalis]|nr:hypothetical protein BLOT_011202 [Blomia tropicalis]